MKIKCILLFWWYALVLFSQSGTGAPLINSQFARDNPGKIPYSSCRLLGTLVAQIDLGLVGFGEGSDIVWLRCKSKKHGLTAKIPVRMGRSFQIGLGFGFREGFLDLEVSNLHQKTLGQLFGQYKGASAGLAGIGLQKHVNAHGISISGVTGGSGMSAVLSWGKFKLHRGEDIRIERFRNDPYVLFADTIYPLTKTSFLFDQPYFFVNQSDRQMSRISLRVVDGVIPLSIGGDLLIDQKAYIKLGPRLISEQGEKINLMEAQKGMYDRMILVENQQGAWAYQTLQGTFVYRSADEVLPDFDQLSQLQFVKDDANEIFLAQEFYDDGPFKTRFLDADSLEN